MIETVYGGAREPVSFWKKLNPIWWMGGPEGFKAPLINNGTVYLPGIDNEFVRSFYWFWRNPFMNFVGFVIGVEDKDYHATGTRPVMLTTWADRGMRGWKWSVIHAPISVPSMILALMMCVLMAVYGPWLLIPTVFLSMLAVGWLPFVSYAGRIVFYLGWRPASGGFGFKLVNGRPA